MRGVGAKSGTPPNHVCQISEDHFEKTQIVCTILKILKDYGIDREFENVFIEIRAMFSSEKL